MSFKKFALAMIVAAASAQAQASMVTWGVTAVFDGASVSGTVDFDDAAVQGFYDGYNDPNDTHIFGSTFTLTSTEFGWANQVFSNMTFQPYYYSSYTDGPHVDSGFNANGYYLSLSDSNYASSSFGAGTWAFDRNATPVPATLPLMGLGLAALAFSRKQKAAK